MLKNIKEKMGAEYLPPSPPLTQKPQLISALGVCVCVCVCVRGEGNVYLLWMPVSSISFRATLGLLAGLDIHTSCIKAKTGVNCPLFLIFVGVWAHRIFLVYTQVSVIMKDLF